MRPILLVSLSALVAAFGLVAAGPSDTRAAPAEGAPAANPVVLELFTSQGCSSCPPADRLLEDFARDPSLLAISRPVTYWDKMGWKDTLARKENTDLQWAYVHNFSPGTGIYTPQMVVNGTKATIGSHRQEILDLIAQAREVSPVALAVKASDGGGYAVGLSGKTDADAELVLVALDSSAKVAIGKGENSGRTLSYTNVVLDEQKLGDWRGGKQAFQVAPTLLSAPGADRFAVLLRVLKGGPVLAGAMLP